MTPEENHNFNLVRLKKAQINRLKEINTVFPLRLLSGKIKSLTDEITELEVKYGI